MKYKDFINGGVKYHFEEKEGKLYLISIVIWDKVFEFPNGGIPEGTVEQIAQEVEERIVSKNNDGTLNTIEEFRDFLSGFPEDASLEDILEELHNNHLENIDDEEIESWYNEINNNDDTPSQDEEPTNADSGGGTDEGD